MLAKQLQGAAKSAVPQYIEDVFSTWLYTGTGATQTITNGIDLSGKGGMVWSKCRSNGGAGTNEIHTLIDTIRGAGYRLSSEGTGAQVYNSNTITAFNSTGFAIGSSAINNTNNYTYASWTFRKQAKFFDVVTFTGTSSSNQRVNHSLGSVPGFILVKTTGVTGAWWVYHTSQGRSKYAQLESTAAFATLTNVWGTSDPTSTDFGISSADFGLDTKACVAYLFAHNAGGFGAAGTDNVISCGSFTTNTAETVTVDLGYEPQFVIVKRSDAVGDWYILDTMRGWNNSSSDAILYPNYSNAEGSAQRGEPNATGFRFTEGAVARTYIYIAIRRGPMKTPTSGTSVFSPNAVTGTTTYTTNFPVDTAIFGAREGSTTAQMVCSRLLGNSLRLTTSSTAAETTQTNVVNWAQQTTFAQTLIGATIVGWNFRRAPGFFDVVCYTGDGASTRTINHNLGSSPNLLIVKRRDSTGNWITYCSELANTSRLLLNTTAALTTGNPSWAPTSTTFTVDGVTGGTNGTNATYVAYLFATVTGVSKVGSYTGTGTTLQVDCGFAAGARFVLIKRTDSTGDWYVWDTARGIVSGNDPHLSLNTTAGDVTTDDTIDPDNSGFIVNQVAATNVNVNNASYIFLAVS